jgi:hypothetical protein
MNENDFRLTDYQKGLVKQFCELHKQMKDAGISTILCTDLCSNILAFVNGMNAQEYCSETEYEDNAADKIDIGHVLYSGTFPCVCIDYVHQEWMKDHIYAIPKGVELY